METRELLNSYDSKQPNLSKKLQSNRMKELLSRKLIEKVEYQRQVDIIYKKLQESSKKSMEKDREKHSIEKAI